MIRKYKLLPIFLNISCSLCVHTCFPFAAYTMAKYGMSMCVLGMAEELKPDGIAVNALWPRTGIICCQSYYSYDIFLFP